MTRLTIWVSLIGYALGSIVFAVSRGRPHLDSIARAGWTIACAAMIAHFISAFQFFHGWSHTAAYVDTARQTEEVVGIKWGGGVFINYALLILWLIDIGWWWRGGLGSYRRRPRGIVAGWHGFFIFILFNATVIFESGLVRWAGLVLCVVLTITWLQAFRKGLASTMTK